MDAYFRYNQINMALGGIKKITFITTKDIYFYLLKSFILKNDRAIYQRLVSQLFSNILGKRLISMTYQLKQKTKCITMIEILIIFDVMLHYGFPIPINKTHPKFLREIRRQFKRSKFKESYSIDIQDYFKISKRNFNKSSICLKSLRVYQDLQSLEFQVLRL